MKMGIAALNPSYLATKTMAKAITWLYDIAAYSDCIKKCEKDNPECTQ